jgi:glycosyltransferase involved in cell wall biosynthesis
MSSGRHIVFVTPTLNRTGSEWVLVNLLKHLRSDLTPCVITKFKGELYNEIPRPVPKYFLYRKQYGGLISRVVNKLRKFFVSDMILKEHASGIWYINTIVVPDILKFAQANKLRTIVHIHELQQMYGILDEKQIRRLVEYPELIIANSNASASVVKNYGRTKPIEIVYPALSEELVAKKSFSDKRSFYHIPQESFVWVMCGTLDLNKNPFLFIEIANELRKLNSNFKMIWVGGKVGGSDLDKQCDNRIQKEHLGDHVQFIGHTGAEFYDHFAMANGFVLTSQFESFSMTTLEALYLQLPVVANDCVGVNEVLGDEFGYVVRQKNDAREFAEKMNGIMNAPQQDGAKLRQRALTFNIETISEKWNNILEDIF